MHIFLSVTGNQSPSLPFMLVNGNLGSRKVHTLAKTKSRTRTGCEGGRVKWPIQKYQKQEITTHNYRKYY